MINKTDNFRWFTALSSNFQHLHFDALILNDLYQYIICYNNGSNKWPVIAEQVLATVIA